MEVSYPLGGVRDKREMLENNWLPEGYEFVRFGLRSKKSMLIRSVAYLTVEEFRETDGKDGKDFVVERLKDGMMDFLKEDSPFSAKEISSTLITRTLEKLEHDREGVVDEMGIKIILPDNDNIINGVFVFEKNDEKRAYPLFPSSFREEKYTSTSNILPLNKYETMSEYMFARIVYRMGKNDLLELASELEDEKIKCDYALGMTEEFRVWKRHLEDLDPKMIFDIIQTDENYTYNDDEMNIFCSMLQLNICLVRAWSDNVSIEKYYNFKENYPTICIFVVREGYYGPDGVYSDTKYYPGGITYGGKIKYYLDPDKDEMIIYQFLRYSVSNNSNIMIANYNLYLENLRKGTNENTKTQITQLEDIDIPEYGKLEEILRDRGNVDDIGKIIAGLPLR